MEQTDFIVVGMVGYQGTGKSTLLSMIGDSKCINSVTRFFDTFTYNAFHMANINLNNRLSNLNKKCILCKILTGLFV